LTIHPFGQAGTLTASNALLWAIFVVLTIALAVEGNRRSQPLRNCDDAGAWA